MKNWLIFVVLFLFPLTSSAIIINSNPDGIYNLGDIVELNFSVSSLKEVSGFLDSYLICDNDEKLIDKKYIFLNNNKKNFSLNYPLNEEGECKFVIDFLDDEVLSEEFVSSDEIIINYEINSKSFFPNELLKINGTIKKKNGDKYTGTIEISGLTSKVLEVVNGEFYFDYLIPSNTAPGIYPLNFNVKEKNSFDKIINSGKKNDELEIKSKPMSIKIVSEEFVIPPKNFSFYVELLDQAGNIFNNGSIMIKLIDTDKNVLMQKQVSNFENVTYEFSGKAKRGSNYIYAYYGNIFSSFPVYIEDYSAVNVGLEENNIRVENVGNVPYQGIINFSICNDSQKEEVFFNVSLDIGEKYFYPLKYSGMYNISIFDKEFNNVGLTGAAIGVSTKFNIFSYIIPIIFISFLLFLYFFIKSKIKKRKAFYENKENGRFWKKGIGKKVIPVKSRQIKVSDFQLQEEKISSIKNVFMLFLKSSNSVLEYSSLIKNYGFDFNSLNENIGYVIFYGDEKVSSEYKMYNLGKAIKRFSDVKNDKVSIFINSGKFEKKINLLKKFSLFNKKVLDSFPEKFVISDKIMNKLDIKVVTKKEILEIFNRKICVYIIE